MEIKITFPHRGESEDSMRMYEKFLKGGDYEKAHVIFEKLGRNWIYRLHVTPNGDSFKDGYTIMQTRISGGKITVDRMAKLAKRFGYPIEILQGE